MLRSPTFSTSPQPKSSWLLVQSTLNHFCECAQRDSDWVLIRSDLSLDFGNASVQLTLQLQNEWHFTGTSSSKSQKLSPVFDNPKMQIGAHIDLTWFFAKRSDHFGGSRGFRWRKNHNVLQVVKRFLKFVVSHNHTRSFWNKFIESDPIGCVWEGEWVGGSGIA